MGKMKKCFGILLLAIVVIACTPVISVEAADGDYTYTIRFYSGQQGTFAGGQEVITYEGLSYGSIVTFNPSGNNVILNNGSKYYVKGIRESGRDNNTVSASSFMVTGDRDYVVAYGLRGNLVAYTVYYLDVDGNELLPYDTYYGNVGDKPVVAFQYIDSYQPQAYNLTKTLVENEAENVFAFVYTPIGAGQTEPTVTRRVEPNTSSSAVEVIEGDTDRRNSADQDDGNLDEDIGGLITDGQSMSEPFDTLDLDGDDLEDDGIYLEDPSVPLADMKFKLGPIEVDARMLLILIVILIAAAAVAAASWWYWKPYRKKENNEEEDSAQPV